MITLTIVETSVKKGVRQFKNYMKLFKSMDQAKSYIVPIVKEMNDAKKQKREPKLRINSVSWDTNSEKTLLLELGAVITTENESI